jgi:NAD(P)-dependent dehydrogenase (short-subunit alcohol dehydrogenase family)
MNTAMVWGAGGGIGRAVVERLAAEGWTTIGIGRDVSVLPPAASYRLEADVTNPHAVEQAVYSAALEVEKIDLWVYAVGDITTDKIAEMEPEVWSRQMGANLNGAYLTAHYSLPLLAEDAHMVFIGAISERLQLPGFAAYTAAKAGLEAFAAAFGKEERKKRVTVVRPSAVSTPFWDKLPLRMPEEAAAPAKVADKILQAYQEGHKGHLDLTK